MYPHVSMIPHSCCNPCNIGEIGLLLCHRLAFCSRSKHLPDLLKSISILIIASQRGNSILCLSCHMASITDPQHRPNTPPNHATHGGPSLLSMIRGSRERSTHDLFPRIMLRADGCSHKLLMLHQNRRRSLMGFRAR